MEKKEIGHIISRVKKGDHKAFALLVETHKDMVYSLCLKMSLSKEDAEEIAQDAFVKAFQGIHKFKGKSKFSTWLYQITYYTVINNLRKKKVIVSSEYVMENIPVEDSILEEIQQAERQEYIEKSFEYLTPDERAIITFYYLQEQSIEEIALITKLSKSNVKVKLYRTRKKLLSILQGLLKNELNSLV